MTIDNFCFYLKNRLIQTSQTEGQWYSDTSSFSIPWLRHYKPFRPRPYFIKLQQLEFTNVRNKLVFGSDKPSLKFVGKARTQEWSD
jgi:hypothetical protein